MLTRVETSQNSNMANHAVVPFEERVIISEHYMHQPVVYEMGWAEWRGHKSPNGRKGSTAFKCTLPSDLLREAGVMGETHRIRVYSGMKEMPDKLGPLVYVQGY